MATYRIPGVKSHVSLFLRPLCLYSARTGSFSSIMYLIGHMWPHVTTYDHACDQNVHVTTRGHNSDSRTLPVSRYYNLLYSTKWSLVLYYFSCPTRSTELNLHLKRAADRRFVSSFSCSSKNYGFGLSLNPVKTHSAHNRMCVLQSWY